MSEKKFSPESLMMSHGYKPSLSEGAIKCPIFQTSTFAFKSAEEGKAYFELAYGLREKNENEELGLIYSRINNPDLEILENRLCLWDEADDCCVFESGMSAISTVLLEFLAPGDVLLYSNPVYGGTDHFIKHFLLKMGIKTIGFHPWQTPEEIGEMLREENCGDKLKLVHIETPANPTNTLTDIEEIGRIAKQINPECVVCVDNTYMGPLWQHPLKLGADLVVYSATKYIGGHSDVIAGAVLGHKEPMLRVRTLRTFLGNMAGPWTGWLLLRSLETLKLRMEQQCSNAQEVAQFLNKHPKVESVNYLGLLEEGTQQHKLYKKQCSAPGAMVTFNIKGKEKEAFRFLNALSLMKLAVSLGSTESLAQHPASMTHAGVLPDERLKMGITENLVRLSIGVEKADDLISDIGDALKGV
tara:strand:- start:1675 stop:2916 length:1242 start_codon:yes stop_codon:yes gene_type:complete